MATARLCIHMCIILCLTSEIHVLSFIINKQNKLINQSIYHIPYADSYLYLH